LAHPATWLRCHRELRQRRKEDNKTLFIGSPGRNEKTAEEDIWGKKKYEKEGLGGLRKKDENGKMFTQKKEPKKVSKRKKRRGGAKGAGEHTGEVHKY